MRYIGEGDEVLVLISVDVEIRCACSSSSLRPDFHEKYGDELAGGLRTAERDGEIGTSRRHLRVEGRFKVQWST